jgi:hypothetical protein
MAVKSIIDIDVNDAKFKKFQELFEKYRSAVEDLPDSWKGVNKELVAAVLAHEKMQEKLAEVSKHQQDSLKNQAFSWKNIATSAKSFSASVKTATAALLRWVPLTTIIAGLGGVGALFGIDTLAANVGARRRSALGLGLAYGEQKAFEVNYGRLVDPGSFLSSVNAALHDVRQRYTLYAAGLGEGDIRGNDTAGVSVALIKRLKTLADATQPQFLQQVLESRHLDRFMSLEDFERLKSTPASEVEQYARSFGRDAAQFGLSKQNQLVWQNFQVALQRSGAKIENVFVKGLGDAHIPEALEQLSGAVSESIKTFMQSPKLKVWLKDIGEGLKHFAKMVASGEFQKKIDTFVTDIGLIADATVRALKFLGVIPKTDAEKAQDQTNFAARFANQPWTATGFAHLIGADKLGRSIGDLLSRGLNPFDGRNLGSSGTSAGSGHSLSVDMSGGNTVQGAGYGASPVNNPLNIRPAGMTAGFMRYASSAEGIRAAAALLLRYEDKYGRDTIEKIVSRWAPPSENDTAAYIRDVANRTKFSATQHLDLHNKEVLAKLVSAMAKHENRKNDIPPKVVISVLNNTGGNTVVSSNQMAKPQ